MAHHDEGFQALPAYGARASVRHRLARDAVDASNRHEIVLSGIGPQNVPILFRADGIILFEFDKSPGYSGGVVDPYFVDDVKGAPKSARLQCDERDAIREKRFRYMNAFLTCFHIAANASNHLSPPLSKSHHIWARLESGSWRMMDNGDLIAPIPAALTIELPKLEGAMLEFNKIDGPQLAVSLDTLAMYYRVAFNMLHHEYQTVVILGWAIVEGCQDRVWKNLIEGGYKRSIPIRKLPESGRNFC
jgi:hypothetical protein